MPALIIPLGVIVDTDASRSINAFQSLCNELKLGVRVDASLDKLFPIFLEYNTGKYTEEQFAEHLLATVDNLIPAAHRTTLDNTWKRAWLEKWQEHWNSMCELDDRAIEVARLIAKSDTPVYIYSETNPTHFAHIMNALALKEVFLKPSRVFSTFDKKINIVNLLTGVMARCAADKNGASLLLMGNIENVKDSFIHQLAVKKLQAITQLANENGQALKVLNDKFLTPEEFLSVVDEINAKFKHELSFV